MGDFQLWYKELPFVTKTYMTSCLITTALISFNLINPRLLILDFDHKIQVKYYIHF